MSSKHEKEGPSKKRMAGFKEKVRQGVHRDGKDVVVGGDKGNARFGVRRDKGTLIFDSDVKASVGVSLGLNNRGKVRPKFHMVPPPGSKSAEKKAINTKKPALNRV